MIRLARTGAKKKPQYRVVVIEKANARDGRFVEIVGHYNPRKNPVEVVLKRERIDYWVSRGAQASDTVRGLLRSKKEEPSPQAQVA
jgi:small subunit ribosomal protein S16